MLPMGTQGPLCQWHNVACDSLLGLVDASNFDVILQCVAHDLQPFCQCTNSVLKACLICYCISLQSHLPREALADERVQLLCLEWAASQHPLQSFEIRSEPSYSKVVMLLIWLQQLGCDLQHCEAGCRPRGHVGLNLLLHGDQVSLRQALESLPYGSYSCVIAHKDGVCSISKTPHAIETLKK